MAPQSPTELGVEAKTIKNAWPGIASKAQKEEDRKQLEKRDEKSNKNPEIPRKQLRGKEI